ncbi:MAG: Ada metal-binding domain-containing protein [Candidatus Woesearchaeota archaeon]
MSKIQNQNLLLYVCLVLDIILIITMFIAQGNAAKTAFSILFLAMQLFTIIAVSKRKRWNSTDWYALALMIFNLGFLGYYTIAKQKPVFFGVLLIIAHIVGLVLASFQKQKAKILVYNSKPGDRATKNEEQLMRKELQDIKNELQNGNGNHLFMAKKQGKKYHRSNCMVLAKAEKKELTSFESKADAESQGFRPCKICVE